MPVVRCPRCQNPLTDEETRAGTCPCCKNKVDVAAKDTPSRAAASAERSISANEWEKVSRGLRMMLVGSVGPLLAFVLLTWLFLPRSHQDANVSIEDINRGLNPLTIGLAFLVAAVILVGSASMVFGMLRCRIVPEGKWMGYGAGWYIATICAPMCGPLRTAMVLLLMLLGTLCAVVFFGAVAGRASSWLLVASNWSFAALFASWSSLLIWIAADGRSMRIFASMTGDTELVVRGVVSAALYLWYLGLMWSVRRAINVRLLRSES